MDSEFKQNGVEEILKIGMAANKHEGHPLKMAIFLAEEYGKFLERIWDNGYGKGFEEGKQAWAKDKIRKN